MEQLPDFITLDNNKFICSICNKELVFNRDMSKIQSHIGSNIHKKTIERIKTQESNTKEGFEVDLVKMLSILVLLLSLLDNSIFREFLEKYTKYQIPYSNDVRHKNIINNLSNSILEKIRQELSGKKISVQSDSSTDNMNSYITNIIVRELNESTITQPYLIDVDTEHKAHNGNSFCFMIHDTLMKFFKKHETDNVVLFVTDQSPYCCKAGKMLKECSYTKMNHVTCFAHIHHNLSKKIYKHFHHSVN